MNNDPSRTNANHGAQTDGANTGKDPDELSNILEQVDSQLSALRKMRDERDQRLLEVTQREAELSAAAEQLAARESELNAQQQGLEELEQEISTRNEQVAARDAELSELRVALASEREKLDAAMESMRAERTRLDKASSELAAREQQAEAQVAEFKRISEEASANAQNAMKDAAIAEEAVQELNRRLEDSVQSFETAQQEFESRLAQEQQAYKKQLGAQQQEFESRFESASASYKEQAARLEQDLREARQQAESFKGEITQLNERVSALAEQAGRAAELEKKIAQREQQLAQLVQAVSEYESEIDRLSANGTKDAAAIDERLNQRDEQIKLLESQLEQANTQAQGASNQATQELQSLKQEADHLRAEVASRDKRIEELVTGASDGASQTDALRAEIDQRDAALKALEAKLSESRAKIEELQESLDNQTPASTKKDTDKLRHEVARRDEAIRTLHARLEKASSGRGGGTLGAKELEAIERRRQRLANYRDVLREKTTKLSKAKKTIEARYAQLQQASAEVKQLDESRRAVASERIALERLERKVRKARAKSNAWMLLASMAVTLGIIGFGAWWGVGQFVKPTYLAHTTLGVGDAAVDLSGDQIEMWQEFHESLLEDPKLLDMAAERMRRRGLETLSTAGDLDWHIKENMDLTSKRPGEMTLTLRGEGGARTERILSTLATAIVGLSGDTRDLRADQTSAAIIEPVKVDSAPIEDPRLAVFGAVFGAAAALTLFAGVVFSRKLAATKEEFEEEMAQPEEDFGMPHEHDAQSEYEGESPDDSVPPHGTITGGPPIRRPV